MKRRHMLFRLVAVGVVIVVAAYFLKLRDTKLREHDDQMCQGNMKEIILALHAYHESWESFPPAYVLNSKGQRAHSWRVLLLPYLGEESLHDQYRFDEPWDGPNNAKLADQMPDVYRCPADTRQTSTVTNYMAIVSGITAWPEHYSMSFSAIYRGTSGTIFIVESCDSGVHWMEPRDLTFAEAAQGINPGNSPSISCFHGDHANCATGDSQVHSLKNDINEDLLIELMTHNSGHPFRDLPAPPEYYEVEIGEFVPTVDAEDLRTTDVHAVLTNPIQNRRNYVYCATFQLAWDFFDKRSPGSTTKLPNPPNLVKQLNDAKFPTSALSEDSYIAMVDVVKNGKYQQLSEQLERRFPHVEPPVPTRGDVFITYAYLEKNLPFVAKFRSRQEPLPFQAGNRKVPVENFGFEELHKPSRVTRQVKVHHYRNKNDFVIRLKTRSDQIVLAKIQPEATLAETLALVRRRIYQSKNYARPTVEAKDTLIIPKINFSVNRRSSELIGVRIDGKPINDATQLVRFLLNEAGARVASEVRIPQGNGHEEEDPDAPRDMRFDKPFLLYLQEVEDSEPYLVAWIANAELLVRAN